MNETETALSLWTENTGGDCMLDHVLLPDRRVLTIFDCSICIWPSMQDLEENNTTAIRVVTYDIPKGLDLLPAMPDMEYVATVETIGKNTATVLLTSHLQITVRYYGGITFAFKK